MVCSKASEESARSSRSIGPSGVGMGSETKAGLPSSSPSPAMSPAAAASARASRSGSAVEPARR